MKYKQNTDRIFTKWKISTKWNAHALDTESKLNVNKAFRRCPVQI